MKNNNNFVYILLAIAGIGGAVFYYFHHKKQALAKEAHSGSALPPIIPLEAPAPKSLTYNPTPIHHTKPKPKQSYTPWPAMVEPAPNPVTDPTKFNFFSF